MSDVAEQYKFDEMKARADRAEAACAEMRAALEDAATLMHSFGHKELARTMMATACKQTPGQGWHSSEEVATKDARIAELEQQLAEARKDSEKKLVLLERICGYLETVRLDRLDETGEFALQTVDWCNGLLEFVEEFNHAKGAE